MKRFYTVRPFDEITHQNQFFAAMQVPDRRGKWPQPACSGATPDRSGRRKIVGLRQFVSFSPLGNGRSQFRRFKMYKANFLDDLRRFVAFDAETTGKRTPDASFIRKQPFAWKAPGIIIEVGFVEMLRGGDGWRKGETWRSLVNPDGPIDPAAIKIHNIRPADLKGAPRFPMILSKLRSFIGDSQIVAHAYRNERDFLNYEFARAKVIEWGDSAYGEARYICTQKLFAQLFPGAGKSLTSMCDRLALDASERDDRHGALLDADMTADALILLEHQLKHGQSAAPRSWTSV
jgi:DNA polymerase-3 subunit epsilon